LDAGLSVPNSARCAVLPVFAMTTSLPEMGFAVLVRLLPLLLLPDTKYIRQAAGQHDGNCRA